MKPPVDVRAAALAAGVASVGALALLLAYLAASGTLPTLQGGPTGRYVAQFVGLYVLGVAATVGVPVALYYRYGLVGPLAVLALDVAFWAVAALAGSGDAPAAFFAVALWPAYLLAHLAVAGGEYALRSRGVLPSLPSGA